MLFLLNGEHYASQLESAWPCTRPVAELLSRVSGWSGMPNIHRWLKGMVDSCCAAVWSTDDGHQEPESTKAGGMPPSPQPTPQAEAPLEAKASPAPEKGFQDFHMQWQGLPPPRTLEFCGFHEQWLGAPEPLNANLSDFHTQWLGKEKSEHLVNSCPVTCRVMLMGDSLMEDFGVYFYQHVKARRGLHMMLLAKFSTGLCRPDYFNWFELFPETMDGKKPHLVLFMIGANDGQPIWHSRGKLTQTRPADAWKSTYGGRVGQLLADTEKRQALPMWVGMPVMGGKYAALLAQTEDATRAECARRSVPYVDNRALLADSSGKYQSFMKNHAGKIVRVRQKDQEHMTPEGNRMLVQAAMPGFEQLLRQHRLNHPELCIYPDQKEELPKPSLEILIPYKPAKK